MLSIWINNKMDFQLYKKASTDLTRGTLLPNGYPIVWWHRCVLMQSNTAPHCTAAASHSHPALRLVYRQVGPRWQFPSQMSARIDHIDRKAGCGSSFTSFMGSCPLWKSTFSTLIDMHTPHKPHEFMHYFSAHNRALGRLKCSRSGSTAVCLQFSTVSLSNQKCSSQNSGKLALWLKCNNPISAHQGVITRLGLLWLTCVQRLTGKK